MAFQIQNFARSTDANNTGRITVDAVQYNASAVFSYQTTADDIATVAAANYFADVVYNLAVGDVIYCVASDANEFRVISAVDREAGTVATVSFTAAGAVGTANITDGAVTLAKLDSGIAPSHVVKFAGQETTAGGAAAEPITVTGALATDLAFVQLVDEGTNTVSVVEAVVTADTLTVTFSADPGADAVINYQLLRAAV